MKIRNKITLTFVLLIAALQLVVYLSIYFLSYRYTLNEFYQRLNERANIVAQSYLERDELSASIYAKIREQYLKTLPGEEELLLKVDLSAESLEDTNTSGFSEQFFEKIFRNKSAQFKKGDRQYSGILYTDNEGDFIVIVSAQDIYGQTKMNNLRNVLLLAFVFGLILVYLLGRFFSGRILEPISEINNKVNEITASNLDLRLHTDSTKDELTELAITFNNMLDRLETAFEIQNNFVNNASHELRTPLTVILGETEVAFRKDRKAEEYKEVLRVVQNEAQRLNLLIQNLLKLAQTSKEKKGLMIDNIRIDELLMDIKNDIDSINSQNNIVIDFADFPEQQEALIIKGNQSLLKVAINNVLDNACKFSGNKAVYVKVNLQRDQLVLSIIDQGIGITDADIQNIKQPFYRASNVRAYHGFGMGLALADKIMKIHGGSIQIVSEINKGSEFRLIFSK